MKTIEKKSIRYKIKTNPFITLSLATGILISVAAGSSLYQLNNLEKTIKENNIQIEQRDQILKQYKQELKEGYDLKEKLSPIIKI